MTPEQFTAEWKANHPRMACGHVAIGKDGEGKPVCPICIGMHPGANQIATPESEPDLTGRTARCTYGMHREVPSSFRLAFFKHQPEKAYDSYYCGCYGWD